ncbi:hypothetical protein JZO70_07615 [Enterococcus sp. 669A]|uniref:Uncharacterized protein n=1 Tax=Candidatus Enterococcus moelleringii TaxID=2815325 RepID=A0ABS3L8R4_9ENTE|nr:hypothetical protein [Enterococcus sp. 669A]MBO1306023.1 hypothetical protein [Enterococcus sp. 669A]
MALPRSKHSQAVLLTYAAGRRSFLKNLIKADFPRVISYFNGYCKMGEDYEY